MDRYQLIATLLSQEDQANNEYISGQTDRDTWAKSLQIIDERMSVLGVRLGIRPWEEMKTARF